ncbi:tumor protein p53-inducible nuclear protein 2 [Anthonomus grandis grandis]|uniref:tumor protein p53-inducible nuclear protein 2 n=1 Tax=Anthonomus grandis grandis TaxID=2921223 RepID=UPI0021651514|nr:tumor protein p53-inducible nuclear protein 2 [Anthonomus grandis grandis]
MLQNLANYFLGGTTTESSGAAGGVNNTETSSNRVALRTTDHDDGWTLVDCDSEGNSEVYSSEEEEDNFSDGGLERVRLNRTGSDDSLTRLQPHDLEESWFVTPPPCFSSQTGPVQLRTSPLENLLIEHPSMSVYQRSVGSHRVTGQPLQQPGSSASSVVPEEEEMEEEELAEEEMVVYRFARNATAQHRCSRALQLNDAQVVKNRRAQKVQMKKVAQQAARGYLSRANKAREANGRNWNPRRKERSQGANRSHANNNRKC